jgi:dipeptidyl-peptidase-3
MHNNSHTLGGFSQRILALLFPVLLITGCAGPSSDLGDDGTPAEVTESQAGTADAKGFVWQTEQFADLKLIRYQVPGWGKLSDDQQKLVYCLTQAGLSGRDVMYDQNNRYNLRVRNMIDEAHRNFSGDRGTKGWQRFHTFAKRVWFSNGIHHHYSNAKLTPECSRNYFEHVLENSGMASDAGTSEVLDMLYDPAKEAKKVELDATKGLVESSAINFYAPDVSTEEAQAYFANYNVDRAKPVEKGLNSRLVKDAEGNVTEEVYKVGGLYGPALEQVCYWLEKAQQYAENDKQGAALRHLVDYYRTGDLEKWSLYNINWVRDTEGDIDYINGFVEVYNDPLGFTGSYETIVQIKDFEASERMAVMMDNAQWFEDHMPFMEEHKKKEVVGITYNVVNVVGEAGDASPSTPIGVNLPNANWIRTMHGSKSVSLGNIIDAYDKAGGSGMTDEFAFDDVEKKRAGSHGTMAGKIHTAFHEVIGHASGQLEPGVEEPASTLKEYASTMEEGRADLVALYFMLDEKLIELGLVKNLETGRAEYDSYIRNGMLMQLRRLEVGADIEEAHMRNRAWVSHWMVERAAEDNCIREIKREGKTYYNIEDYDRVRVLFGELLKEVQRIKSQGDYAAAKALVEGYGVKVDPAIHQEVLTRAEALGIAPYGGFINPMLEAETNEAGDILSVKLSYPDDFTEQMLGYDAAYNFLPLEN